MFAFTVTVYDHDLEQVQTRAQFLITVTLTDGGVLFGTSTSYTTGGVAVFSGIRVLSAGSFLITGTSSSAEVADGVSGPLAIENFVFALAFSGPAWVTANFEFSLEVSVKGEDGLAFVSQVQVAVQSQANLFGTLTKLTQTGTASFQLYFSVPSSYTLQVTCNSKTIEVPVLAKPASLKITSSMPSVRSIQALTSTELFDISVEIRDFDSNLVESAHGPYSVSLSLDPAGSLSGTLTSSSALGVSLFAGLRVLSRGNFRIVASASHASPDQTGLVACTNSVFKLELSPFTLNPSQNFLLDIEVRVLAEDDSLFLLPVTVGLAEENGNLFTGQASKSTSTGLCAFSVAFASLGYKDLRFECSGVYETLRINVVSLKLQIESFAPTVIFSQPSSSADHFTVVVGVYDNNLGTLETSQVYSISLSLEPSGTLSSSSSVSTAAGLARFEDLRVLSDGSFRLKAVSSSAAPVLSDEFSVRNQLFRIEAKNLANQFTAAFWYELPVLVTGEALSLYKGQAQLALACGESFEGDSSSVCADGTCVFRILFRRSGDKTLSISSGSVTAEIVVTVLKLKLQIGATLLVTSIQPSLSTQEFSVSVQVKDNSLTTLESASSYPVTLSLSSSGVLSGVSSKLTVLGAATFTSLRVLSKGTYTLTASSPDVEPESSSSFSVANVPFRLSLAVAPAQLTAYFDFELTVAVYGEDLQLYLDPCTVLLSHFLGLQGQASRSGSSGLFVFNLYVEASGSKTLTASAGGVVASLNVYISQAVLKVTSVVPAVRSI